LPSSRITERRSAASFSSVDSSSGKSTTSLIGMMSCRSSSRRARIFSTARLVERIAAVASSLPSSMRLASVISPSRVSSATLPISRR
jgi:hypothetical protein